MFDADLDYIASQQDPISKQTSLVLTGDSTSFHLLQKLNAILSVQISKQVHLFLTSETMYI